MKRLLVVAVSVVVACGTPPKPAPPPAPKPVLTDEKFDDLTSLAVGHILPRDQRAQVLADLRTGKLKLDDYIDRLVHDPAFSHEVVPHMLLGWLDFGPYSFVIFNLAKEDVDGTTIYHMLRAGGRHVSCKPAQAVDVMPWWDRTTTIKVCPEDYQPTALRMKSGLSCSGITGGSEMSLECGCGPNLINCAANPPVLQNSLHQETVQTIAYIIEHDSPLKELLTTPYSFRDRNVAYAYERDHAMQGRIKEIPDHSDWPAEGKWAPRDEDFPGAHAGILTNRQLLWMTDGPRDRMRLYYERFWCKAPTSFGVDIDVFKKLVHGAADLRNKGARWQQLAAQPGCTKCHARMDYGMQFFSAYPSVFQSAVGEPEEAHPTQQGALYGDDIDDKRAELAMTPRAFGEYLGSQPEFAQCMVEHVEKHVLGTATDAERAELQKTFHETGQIRPVFALALRLYAERAAAPAADQLPAIKPANKGLDENVKLSKKLLGMLDEHCSDCHTNADDTLGFLVGVDKRHSLDREQLLSMGNMIAFGLMPKNQPIEAGKRREMLEELVRVLAPDPQWGRDALGYWSGYDFHGSRIHAIAAMRDRMLSELPAGTTEDTNTRALVDHSLERDLLETTPESVMEMTKIAANACKSVPVAQRYACYLAALRPDISRVQ